MIPVQLQLENFMSYGKGVPPLPLRDIRLACLSGDNGNGKSAILDAITWALFGETRAPREDDLIRLGASDCRVFFDFRVGEGEYRVRKQRDRKGTAVWTLQIYQEDGTPRPLSEGRETKAKIEALLRMDYKTFLSTAYLAQGQADIFARATPAERKRVIGEILDLSRYEEYERRAREKTRAARERKLVAEQTLTQIDAELEEKDRYEVELEAATALLNDAAEQLVRLQTERDQAQTAYSRCEEFELKAREWEEKLREQEADRAESEREAQQLERRIAQAEQWRARRPELEAAQQEVAQLEKRIAVLQSQYDAAAALYREKDQLSETIAQERSALDRACLLLESELQTLDGEARELERLDSESATYAAEIAAYGDLDAICRRAEDDRRVAEDAVADLRALHTTQKAEQERLERRRAALADSAAPECEFCGQPLSPRARKDALAATDAALAALAQTLTMLAQQGREAKRQADERRAALEQLREQTQRVAQLEHRRAHAEQERLRLTERVAQLPERRRAYEQRRTRREQGDFARAEQERLLVISAQLEKVERVGEELRTLRAQLDHYRDLPRDWERLEQAEAILQTEPERVKELQARIAERTERITRAKPRIDEARLRAAELPTLRRALDEADYALRRQSDDTHRAHARIGELKGQLERLAQRAAERSKWNDERTAAARDELIHTELVGAFGKKGVQALIIENALPEIQEETNRLLQRMTGGALTITFETQREAKSKTTGPIETLEIIIADDLGTRPYEMYSGGEAFRVNLALRVALSKMLARRAGAPLQTLILDEGFGTQDPRGREAIADALESISEEFALILIITHIEELKDRFPTRIEVVKGPNGSTFSLE